MRVIFNRYVWLVIYLYYNDIIIILCLAIYLLDERNLQKRVIVVFDADCKLYSV